jgi:hypothetical protein
MASSKRTRDAGQNVTWAQTAPVTATAVTITGVQDTKVDLGISIKQDSADGDSFMTVMFMDMQNPTISFSGIYPQVAAGIPPGNRGTLTFSIRDANGGLTTALGGYTYVCLNTYKMSDAQNYAFRDFGKNELPFGMISVDGSTNPITINTL